MDLDRVQCVASRLECVAEDGVGCVGLVTPGYSLRQAATQHLDRINRNLHGQVERAEFSNEVAVIPYGIGVQAGSVVVLAVHHPCVRRVQNADADAIRRLGDDTQLIDDFASCHRINLIFNRIGGGFRFVNRDAMPLKRLAYMHDALFHDTTLRHLGNLVIDNTVALATGVGFIHRIAEDHANRIKSLVEIALAVDERIFVLTNRDSLCTLGSRVNSQVKTINTIGIVNRQETVLILLGRTDSMLQRLASP